MIHPLRRWTRRASPPLVLAAAISSTACATTRYVAVSPDEIPTLESRVESEPSNGEVRHRYAAALFAAGRCADASAQAHSAMILDPDNVVGPLVVGRCLEAEGRHDEALEVYASFKAEHPSAPGLSAIDGQERVAQQARAVQVARAAIAADGTLGAGPPDPEAVAVLPLLVAGDTAYASLSRGLASIILSDLDLLQRFRLVERLEVDAIVDELTLGRSNAVDQQTAARVGRIIRAGQTVQGTADVASEEQTRLAAAVVRNGGGDGAEAETVEVQGRLEDIMDMEKELVFALAEAMGYTPTLAERQLIADNGTRSLLAFLSFSRGLEAQHGGDYQSAAAYFQQAVTQDPGFSQAAGELQAASAAGAVSTGGRGQVTTVGAQADDAVAAAAAPADGGAASAMTSSIFDVAGLDSERVTHSTDVSGASQQVGTLTRIVTPPPSVMLPGTIRIVIKIR